MTPLPAIVISEVATVRPLEDAKLAARAWVAGMIFAGTALGATIGFLAHKLWDSVSAGNQIPHP